jgi:carbamoyltransferase
MKILGVNAYHGDSSAALVIDGELIAAAEEERFRRIKHWAGFPSEAIRYCLDEANIDLSEIDQIAINQNAKAHLWKKVRFLIANRPDPSFVLDRLKNKKKRINIEAEFLREFPENELNAEVKYIEHHHAHLASAHLVSPFKKSVVVSVDGFGDFASTAWGKGNDNNLDIENRIYFPHSLGIFYQAMTQYLGFPHYGDEYKIMGLAPYGEPKYLDKLREVVKLENDGSFLLNLKYFRHHKEKIDLEWENGAPHVGRLYSSALEELLKPARKKGEELSQYHKDISRSTQAMYEEAFFHLLNKLHDKYNLDALTLAGGCAMNSVANGRIYKNTPFKKLYVQSAAGDAGGAIGAAYATLETKNETDRFHMSHAYWGPQFNNEEIGKLLKEKEEIIKEKKCSIRLIEAEQELLEETAEAISQGLIIGWFQGRMEWGPRALGNRSILADPTRSDIKDIINSKIKRRESFRPFAPSILKDYTKDWFETDDDVPFMMQVYQVNKEKRSQVPAITHVDGSGRLQTVEKETNERYWNLIDCFRKISDVPMLLNTSFNENEPVVCQPIEALNCFLRTNMDVLVIGDWIIRRQV